MRLTPPPATSTSTCDALRVERVLEQLLERRGRALDHLAGGDLIDQQIGQRADRAHQRAREAWIASQPAAPGRFSPRELLYPACVHSAAIACSREALGEIAQDLVTRLERGCLVRRSRRTGAAPCPHQFVGHLDVALKADVPVVDDIRLVGLKRLVSTRVAPAGSRTRRNAIERREARVAAEPGGARAGIRRLDVDPADLRRSGALHARAERLCEQLAAEAMADDGDFGIDGIAQQRDSGSIQCSDS
jgi:hypothetical protein